jgi:hypothetical protein
MRSLYGQSKERRALETTSASVWSSLWRSSLVGASLATLVGISSLASLLPQCAEAQSVRSRGRASRIPRNVCFVRAGADDRGRPMAVSWSSKIEASSS